MVIYSRMLTKIPVLLVLTSLCIAGCSSKQESTPQPVNRGSLQKVTISYGGPLPTLLAIAADQGYFTREGLDVTINNVILGKNAFEDMLAGKSDFSVVAETPVVVKSFARNDFRILATLATTDNLNRIVMRRDRGINSVASLKGRRVATVKGIVPHYFLDLMLAKNGMSEKDIILVFLETDKLSGALDEGSVDAIAATTNIATTAIKMLGEKGMILEEPGLCLTYSLLVSSRNSGADNQERSDRVIKAFRAAELFRQQNPDKSREIVMAALKLSREEHDAIWGKYNVRLALDSAMLLTLEEHANWVMQKGIITQQQIPNFLDFIDASHLQKVAPEAVRLKR